jgi:hypothetical protein
VPVFSIATTAAPMESQRNPKLVFKSSFGLNLRTKYLICFGEPVGIRTRDLLIKSQLLYRLSYGLFCDFRTKAVALVSEFVLFAKWSIAAISASLFNAHTFRSSKRFDGQAASGWLSDRSRSAATSSQTCDAYHEFGFLQGLLFGIRAHPLARFL